MTAAAPTPSPGVRRRLLLLLPGALVVGGLLVATGCAGGSSNAETSGQAPTARPASGTSDRAAQRDGVSPGLPQAGTARGAGSRSAYSGPNAQGGSRLLNVNVTQLGRAQIKAAAIALRTHQVQDVVAQVEQVATGQGGFVDSENTRTDIHGNPVSSLLTIKVPVASFETATEAVSHLGQLRAKKISTQDVTARVVDVASRVASAKQAIGQLRLLFNRATKLGDIITLEQQLSSRQADLEALQAQQRALADQTSLSTITVSVERIHKAPPPPAKPADSSGFVGGLRQGWDALVSTFQSIAHGIGAALPLGLTILLVVSLVWVLVRRLPRHRVDTSG